MKVNLLSRFKRGYKKLPKDIQEDFAEKISLFIKNPRNPKLKTHKLHGNIQHCLAFNLHDGYRVLFEFIDRDTIDLLDIGPHDKYSKWEK